MYDNSYAQQEPFNFKVRSHSKPTLNYDPSRFRLKPLKKAQQPQVHKYQTIDIKQNPSPQNTFQKEQMEFLLEIRRQKQQPRAKAEPKVT
jgi:hypothetical protein